MSSNAQDLESDTNKVTSTPPGAPAEAKPDAQAQAQAQAQQADAAQAQQQADQNGGRRRPKHPKPPVTGRLALAWVAVAIVFVAGAAGASYFVARGTAFTAGQRAAAAWASLLVVAALAVAAQAILLRYQVKMWDAKPDNVKYRRRGLKAAVMGQDGRASTSKTQVVLWTGAVVWALVDLLLLARVYQGGTLFTNAVTSNWRPEYLVLLGLPVAAATAAKAAVVNSNSGRGPLTETISADKAADLKLSRVYVRPPQVKTKGFLVGVAELFTGDDGAVAWADLQYVVFTLITLTYFMVQFLARPADGLPPVPAVLLTLMGVSASTYTANKVVNTKGTSAPVTPVPAQDHNG
jgi:hypothetical protein